MSEVVRLLESLLSLAKDEATTPAPAPQPVYLTIQEFAKRLGVTTKAVRGMLRDGMPHIRPRPRMIRIPIEKAEQWCQACTRAASEDVADARRIAICDAHRGEVH